MPNLTVFVKRTHYLSHMHSLMTKIAFFTAVLLFGIQAIAQPVTNRLNFDWTVGPTVLNGSDTISYPFMGGADLPQWSKVDLNLDGIEDLAVFDRQGNRWITFLAENNTWIAAPEYAQSLPAVEYWGLFRDYNCDGKKDLFAFVLGGIGVWENTSTSDSLSFTWALTGNYLTTNAGGTSTNLYNFSSDIPAIVDIDDDGDLDILTFGQRSTIEWHEGLSQCALDFSMNTTCWGRFEENLSTNNLTLNGCAGVQKMEIAGKNSGSMHAGSSLLVLNLNGDTLKDVLIGDVSFTNLVAAYNGGHMDSAFMVSKDTLYPLTNPTNIQYFPAPFYEDVNFDGTPDLIVSPNLNGSINTRNAWFYENTGSVSNPSWAAPDSAFIVDGMLDLGSASKPALVDLDFDGDYDLVVGSMGKYQGPSTYKSKLVYFKNIGTNTNAKFELANSDFANAGFNNLGEELCPTFADLDADLDPDMIIGAKNGLLYYYENTGSFLSHSFTYRGAIQSIDVGNHATPYLGDVDGDGTTDLLIGNEDGTIAYYKKTGAWPNLFTLESAQWAGVDMSSLTAPSGYSAPAMIFGSDTTLFIGSEDLGVVQKDSLDIIFNGAASVDIVLGGGTQSSNGRIETPFGGSKRNGRTQIIFTKDELIAGGGRFGQIETIGFEIGTNNSLYLTQGFNISIKHITDTAQSSFQNQDFTEVYSGIRVMTTGWNDIPLDVPFTWNGVDHILVEVCFSKHAQTGDIPVVLQSTPFHAMHYGDVSSWNGITNNGCSMPYGGKLKLRPNMRFNLVPTLRDMDAHFTYAGKRLHPAVADLNADGYPDVILGNMSGGLHYFEGKAFNDIGVQEELAPKTSCILYPNPTSSRIQFDCTQGYLAYAHVLNLQGQLVGNLSTIEENYLNLPAGSYIVLLYKENGMREAHRVIVQ
mgnify:CR=1 FL=1